MPYKDWQRNASYLNQHMSQYFHLLKPVMVHEAAGQLTAGHASALHGYPRAERALLWDAHWCEEKRGCPAIVLRAANPDSSDLSIKPA